MKKTDEQLAQELDLLLTARLQGKSLPPVSEELLADMAFVEELLETAEQSGPEPFFLSNLESRLSAEAAREQKHINKSLERPTENRPFWENLILFIKETFTMKRTVFAL
ncbi:MAG: hypothetical protein GWO38_03640, partial [Phycisphaerae bacterium]|nr:hypothetical protein [Phycisphaerae bacterium]NIX26737.1 hypothetical protein [Phycisphaerae bacterium]